MSDAPLPSELLPNRSPSNTLVRGGGALGIAGCCIGLTVFLVACAGFDAAFNFSFIPLAMGTVGLGMTIAGAAMQRGLKMEDTHVIAAFFINLRAFVGGLM